MKSPYLLLVALALWVLPCLAEAQEPLEFRCHFEVVTSLGSGTFDPRRAQVAQSEFELIFVIDSESTKAFVVGNAGTAEVAWRPISSGGGAIMFVETVASGTVQVTVADAAGNAVHSRHTVIDQHFTQKRLCKLSSGPRGERLRLAELAYGQPTAGVCL